MTTLALLWYRMSCGKTKTTQSDQFSESLMLFTPRSNNLLICRTRESKSTFSSMILDSFLANSFESFRNFPKSELILLRLLQFWNFLLLSEWWKTLVENKGRFLCSDVHFSWSYRKLVPDYSARFLIRFLATNLL